MLLDDGGLRYIRLGARELVRRIYSAVRDANWGTVPGRIQYTRVELGKDSFDVEFDVEHQQAEIDFVWHGTIRGEATGRIVFEFRGISHSDFRKNRIGFCILHPLEIAGQSVQIRRADGSTANSEFPRWIAPQNPFLNVVGMRHAAAPGVDVELTFEGDLFETEDQRNWLDASFKTFCTPLSQPFPVEVHAGERFFQQITIELHGQPEFAVPRSPSSTAQEVRLELENLASGKLPAIGFDLPVDAEPLAQAEIQRLRLLKPAHLRCELRLSGDYAPSLQKAAAAAAQLATALDVALFLAEGAHRELADLVSLLRRLNPPIVRWAIFPETGWATTRPLAELATSVLRAYDARLPIGGGTPANFLELNRSRPPVELLDFVTWSQNPQVHATDEASIVETLAAHAALIESAHQFAGGLPLVVGPITFKPRVNPYATGKWPPAPRPGELPPDVDPRQTSPFAAAWTLGSLKYLAEGAVAAATYYEPAAAKGLMERGGGVFPLYQVFADLAELPHADVLPVRSSQPLAVEALAVQSGGLLRVFIANLSPHGQQVALMGGGDPPRRNLELAPHAIACMDLT